MLRRITLGMLLLAAVRSAYGQIGAPQLGWVPDSGHIRPVYGIPSAAAVGAAVIADQTFARIAASRDYVLVSAADTGIVSTFKPEIGLTPLEAAGNAPDSIVVSPQGSSAALWFASSNQIQVVTGLPASPAIRVVDASFLGTNPSALAVSDDGAWIAGAWDSGVYAFGPSGEVNRLPIEDAVAALAFFPGKHDLAVASSSLVVVTGIGGFAIVSPLASISGAAAIAVALDGRSVIAANAGGSITVVQIESGAATTVDCGCTPEGLNGLSLSAFRLTGVEGGAFKLFDTATGEVLFAPLALREGAAQ